MTSVLDRLGVHAWGWTAPEPGLEAIRQAHDAGAPIELVERAVRLADAVRVGDRRSAGWWRRAIALAHLARRIETALARWLPSSLRALATVNVVELLGECERAARRAMSTTEVRRPVERTTVPTVEAIAASPAPTRAGPSLATA